MGFHARRPLTLLVAGAAMAVLVACGGSSGNSGTSGPGSPAGSVTVAGTAVTVTETEYSIDLSPSTFTPGTYTFTIKNTGAMPHNLNVNGPGIDNEASATIQPGDTGQLTVTLQQGSYELWCSIDSHKDQGMDKTIQVG
jgi:uncharacterized cupredoxin-like copper-binding protein